MDIVMKYYPKPSKERRTKWIQNAMSKLNKHGIVGMHDAGVFPSELKLYKELSTSDAWTVRVYAMAECETRNTFCAKDVTKISTPNGNFHMQSVKLFAGKFFYSSVKLYAHAF
jgi:predicted amidohydrolase YtcJ